MVLFGCRRACCRLARGAAIISDNAIGQYIAQVRINGQFAFERRNRTLMAIGAFANATGYANWLKSVVAGHVHPVRIDQIARMAHLASQRDGIATQGGPETPRRLCDIPCKADVAHPIRCFRQLT